LIAVAFLFHPPLIFPEKEEIFPEKSDLIGIGLKEVQKN